MQIVRKRWVILRNKTDIFCGLARNYQFKPINDIGDTAIKTYLSCNKAMAAFERSWYVGDDDKNVYSVAEVIESIVEVNQ